MRTRRFLAIFLFISLTSIIPSLLSAATRGISVVAKTTKGQSQKIQLYDYTAALIVGIDRYENLGASEQLTYAVKDAKGVEKVLRDGFQFDEIVTLYNEQATRDKIMQMLYGFCSLTPDGGVFVYFAGHGITIPGTLSGKDLGYLIPHDGSLNASEMYKNISMQQVKSDLCVSISAKHIFFVFDACFAGLMLDTRSILIKPSRDFSYLKAITDEQVRQVLTAGSKGETVLDGGLGGHSVFTGRLIQALENTEDYITARELGQYLKKRVYGDAAARGHTQRPVDGEIYGTGDFVFVSNYEQKLHDRLLASQAEVKRARERKEGLSHTYALLVEDERNLKKKIKGQKHATQNRQMKREKAALESKKRAYKLEKARVEEELRKREALQIELEKQLQEQAKIQGTMKDLEQDLAKSYREMEEKKRLELVAIQRDKEVELLRVKRLMEEIKHKRESLEATKLESLSIGDAMQEYKSIKHQMEAVSNKYDKHLASALKDLKGKYDNQRKRYAAEIEKLDKALMEYEVKINNITRKYYSNPPKKDMFETQHQFQKRLANYKTEADGKAAMTRKDFAKGLKSIKAQREKLDTAKFDLADEYQREKKGLQDKMLTEKEKGVAIYKRQLDGIVNQTYILPTDKVELRKYSPEFQEFRIAAFIQINRQRKGVSFRIGIPGKEARMLWNNREFIRGEAVLKLKPASNDVTVTSIDIIDDVHSKKYSCNDVVQEVGRDDRFVAYNNGIVVDTKTGFEWKAGPDKNTDWNDAHSWVQNLNLDGGGWRMPTMDELTALYKKGTGSRNMTPLLKTTGWWVWSGETEGSSGARYFSFSSGNRYWSPRSISSSTRAFAVHP